MERRPPRDGVRDVGRGHRHSHRPELARADLVRRESAAGFWHSVRDALGPDPLAVEEEHDLGDRALWRLKQTVSSPSGVQSAYSWSFLITARQGKVIMVEFFIDDAALLAELGIAASRAARLSRRGVT
jgi:ketosteroid isomerase-like protein